MPKEIFNEDVDVIGVLTLPSVLNQIGNFLLLNALNEVVYRTPAQALVDLGVTPYTHPTGDGNLHVPANGTTNSGKVLTAGSSAGVYTWQTIPAGVTDHTLLSNIGTNTHVQIDSHIADTTKHFAENPNWNTAYSWGNHAGLYLGITANAVSATKLMTARTINGVAFDGTTNITIVDNTKETAFIKNTAFNKNFGVSAGTVSEGDHLHTGLYQPIGTYDNYVSWNLKTNGVQRIAVVKDGTLDINAGTNISVSYGAGGVVTIANTFTPSAEVNDLTSSVTWVNVPIANVPTGTTGSTVALGNHLHAGVYEPVFSKNTGFNKNFGTTAGTVSQGNHTHTFASLTSKPTTISGYGITDFNSLGDLRWAGLSHNHAGVYEPVFSKNTAFNSNFSTTPTDIKINGAQSLGVLSTLARADHVHPTDTSRQAALSGTGFVKISGTTISYDNNTYALASSLGSYLPLAGGTMSNTNLVNNLNADLLRGVHWGNVNTPIINSDYIRSGNANIRSYFNNSTLAQFVHKDRIVDSTNYGILQSSGGAMYYGGLLHGFEFGDVGIGTTSPSYKLDVTGTGRFTGDVIVPDEVYGAGWNGSLEVPTKNAVYDKIETLGGASYKVYTALISQSGTSAPTATVLENTLGGTVTFTYNSTGVYFLNLTGAFVSDKTWFTGQISAGAGNDAVFNMYRFDSDSIRLTTNAQTGSGGGLANAILTGAPIEIRVYP